MRLAEFLLSNMEAILVNWEAFAATRLPAAAKMDSLALRDHARQMLEAIAHDVSMPQTREAQTAKSMGLAIAVFDAPETAAQTHAVLRARSGFDINQLAAEYRALRASVLRLWLDDPSSLAHIDDMIRFNEAVDQALAESVSFFSARVEQSRNLLLGILGHDLRSPLNTIQLTAHYLGGLNAGEEVSVAAVRLINSGHRMQGLLDDLLDFNRTNFGLGINVVVNRVDLEDLLAQQIEQIRGAYPDARISLQTRGDTWGNWDASRLQQLIDNLVSNAIKYGAPGEPVRVSLDGEGPAVRIEVTNRGPGIEPSLLQEMFEPLRRGPGRSADYTDDSLGLGLYIAREIAKAHGGGIEATSVEGATTFVVTLRR